MTLALVVSLAIQFSLVLTVFSILLLQSVWWGRQTIVNIIVGTLLAVVFFTYFPYFDLIPGSLSGLARDSAEFAIFAIIAFCTILLTKRIMPEEYREGHFESILKKILLALAGTILFTIVGFTLFSAQAILINTSPHLLHLVQSGYIFWWLLVISGILWYAS